MNYGALKPVESTEGIYASELPDWVMERDQPLVMRGLISDWPAIPSGVGDYDQLERMLSQFWNDKPVTAYVAPAPANGRFSYNEAFNGFNFRPGSAALSDILARLREQNTLDEAQAASIYVGSTPVDGWLPGFQEANALDLKRKSLVNFWLGNRTNVSAHFDFPSNIACVVYGVRRFTLFPIEQVENLYVGPLDRTPSGQPISLVDFDNPDFERFPRFKEALEAAQTAELQPGDAIFIPSMWWHQVNALSDCNLLVNYWWLDSPEHLGSPYSALLHAVMSIRQLPETQRKAWQVLMNHYVFESCEEQQSHIPSQALGCLGPMAEADAAGLRAELVRRLQ